MTDVIRYVSSSLPGASFPHPSGVHGFKGHHYRVERGQVLLEGKGEIQATERRRQWLPAGHTAVYCLQPLGLVSYDPTRMHAIDPASHRLAVLCQPDLSPLAAPAAVALPYEDQATRYLVQGSTVILFKPYTEVRLDREYYRAISVYRWNAKRQAFDRVLHWAKDQFHITCASSTHDYVALSRLPYNPAALEEEMQKRQLHASHTETVAMFSRTVTMLQDKVGAYEVLARRRADEERREAERKQREATELLARQQRERAEQYRRADPMDFFVWDKSARQFTRVLEYTRPVDQVLVTNDRKLYVGINTVVQEGANQRTRLITHTFDIQVVPDQVASYDWGPKRRVKVDKLAEDL